VTRSTDKPRGIRIGELSALTGVSRDTIKFYLKEGLIPRPQKTGRTMSYYDPSCVERIRLIKRLQGEHFLPLQVIKGVLENKNVAVEELALVDAFLGLSVFPDPVTGVSLDDLKLKTGYSDEDIERIESAGLIGPRSHEFGREFSTLDLRVLSLIRRRERAGFSLGYSIEMMGIYRDGIARIVRAATQQFATRAATDEDLEKMVQNVSEGERALVEFMPLIRAKLTHEYLGRTNVQFQRIPERLAEIFRFRGPRAERVLTDTRNSPDLLMGLADDIADPAVREAAYGLVDGVRSLIAGRHRQALEVFERVVPVGPLGPVAASLVGLAHLMRAAGAEGYLQAIRDSRTAMSFLTEPPPSDIPTVAGIVTNYLRAAGLAAIPDTFATHYAAAEIAEGIFRAVEGALSGGAEGAPTGVMAEIRAKTRSVMATMYRFDEDPARAEAVLREIEGDETSPPYYRSWARRELAAPRGR
jgi:DNA-binding transcriptional MerR regulator